MSYDTQETNESGAAQLSRANLLDPVTGLPGRPRMLEHLNAVLNQHAQGALVMIDLDDFAIINQTHGHTFGDHILHVAGQALADGLSPKQAISYWGGDRFCLYLPDLAKIGHITCECSRLACNLQTIDRNPGQLNSSIGVAIFPKDADNAEDLIAHADFALDQARADNAQIHFFDPAMRKRAQARSRHEARLHHALTHGEFEIFYQPQFCLADRRITGAEALIRWRHPEDGLMPPCAFLPALENSALAILVGNWILQTACAQACQWRERYDPDFTIAVNIFGAQLKMSDFEGVILRTLSETCLPAHALEIEITENIALDEQASIIGPLQHLRDKGVGIALDDYGTGYASLSLLKYYPLSRLKIDRDFVRPLVSSAEDRALVRAILDLSTSFNLQVIAEGVETAEQLELLYQAGCREGQGHLVGKAVPASTFEQHFLVDAAIK